MLEHISLHIIISLRVSLGVNIISPSSPGVNPTVNLSTNNMEILIFNNKISIKAQIINRILIKI